MSSIAAFNLVNESIKDVECPQITLHQTAVSTPAPCHSKSPQENVLQDAPVSQALGISSFNEERSPSQEDKISETRKKAIVGLIVLANFVPVSLPPDIRRDPINMCFS